MEKIWKNYQKTLIKELGEDLAKDFVGSLQKQANDSVKIAVEFFYKLGQTWAPIMYLWANWIKTKAQGESIALILRDAKPLEVLPSTIGWKKLYINRQNCGISDEISGDYNSCHPLLRKYLLQNSCSKYFTFVDSGCYGTIVLELHKLGINFQPLFFFSKNPHIPGFLNDIGITEVEGEILNDSLECAFPNIHERPDTLIEIGDSIEARLEPADQLSVLFGKAALNGVKDFNFANCVNPTREAKKLIGLSQQARLGQFTGILAHSSPEWSKKKEFLENWPKELFWL